MIQCNTLNVRLSNLQLNPLELIIILRVSRYFVDITSRYNFYEQHIRPIKLYMFSKDTKMCN